MRVQKAGWLAIYAVASLGIGTALSASADESAKVGALLKERLPKTAVNKVDCSKIAGICEVTAGSNLFYVDQSARYLMIGRVYDMETRQDVTAARLLELNPDMLIGGAASAARREETAGEQAQANIRGARPTAAPAAARKVNVAGLPANGAIVWGAKSGTTVTVFSDFRCGYCQQLSETLAGMNVRVVERPISVLGSRQIANEVLCSKDQPAALALAYRGQPVGSAGKCDTSGLDANERFARENGFAGTPVIVRSDGAVLEGFRPRETLIAWLKEAR